MTINIHKSVLNEKTQIHSADNQTITNNNMNIGNLVIIY